MKNSANFRLYALLGTATVLYFFANFQRAGVPGTIFDQLQSTLGLSATAISGLSSAFMYIYAFGQLMAVVGEGNINFDAVISAAESAGTQYLLVEQDNCNGEDPFDCLKRSYENMKAMGLN